MNRKTMLHKSLDILVAVVAIFLGLVMISPVLYCVLSAFKSRAEFAAYPPVLFPEDFSNLTNFAQVFEKTPIMRFMFNSLIVSTIGTFARILFAAFAAFAFAYYNFKGKKLLFFVVLATMMLPGDTLIITNYLTVSKMGLLDNYLGMCITSLVGATQMFMLRQHFKTIPKEMYEAAQLDGCGNITYILRIVGPISQPILVTLCVQSFIGLWNTYLWPLLITNKAEMRTVQVGVTMLTTPHDTNYSLVMAAVVIVLIPSFILFIILRRNIVEGMSTGALVG
ncbi:MAG: carbohydrate ABC transporter permease [Acetanaerobacterium sp.]